MIRSLAGMNAEWMTDRTHARALAVGKSTAATSDGSAKDG